MTQELLGIPVWLDLLLLPLVVAEIWLIWRLMPKLLDWLLRVLREHEAERVSGWSPEQLAAMSIVIRSLGMSYDEATKALTLVARGPSE
jgi:hypothetical protein